MLRACNSSRTTVSGVTRFRGVLVDVQKAMKNNYK
jgi:hypothetical protein